LGAGFLTGRELTRLALHHPTSYTRVPPHEWPHAWFRMLEETWHALAPGTWPLMLAVAAAVAVGVNLLGARLRDPATGKEPDRGIWSTIPWREAAALIVTALLLALALGTRFWIRINNYAPRYLLPSVFLLQAALAMLIVKPLGYRLLSGRYLRFTSPIAALLLLVGIAAGYGVPSLRGVRADIERFNRLTPDVLATPCTFIAGDYWTVWPAVFHANLTLYERGEARTIWGVTLGGQPTSRLWWHVPQKERCVCIPVNDPYGDNWLLAFGFSRFRDVERRATVRVLRRQPEVRAAAPNR
jgi:hypothetical protein